MDGLGGESLSLMLLGGTKISPEFFSLTSWIFVKVNMKVQENPWRYEFETRFVLAGFLLLMLLPSRIFCFPFHACFLSFAFLPGLLFSFFPLYLGVVFHSHHGARKLMKGAGRHQHFPTIREVQPDSCLFVHLDELIQQYLPT